MNNPDTLLAKIFGLHKMKLYKSKQEVHKIYFLIMANLFSTPLEIDLRYDLKGLFHLIFKGKMIIFICDFSCDFYMRFSYYRRFFSYL